MFNSPGMKFKEFKENESHSYPYYSTLFTVLDSALKRITSGKTELSYSMYLKFKKLGVFEELKKIISSGIFYKKSLKYNLI